MDLRGASLFRAQLQGASLDGAGLQDAFLNGAQLQGASLVRAQLQGASLVATQLQSVSLNGAQLQGALLDSAQLQGASLFGAQLQGASLNSAQLQGASLNYAQLQGASLNSAQLRGASLNGAQLQGALLFRADLQGASLFGAQLQGASLARAQLQGASLKLTFVWRATATSAVTRNTWIEPVSPYASLRCDNRATNDICDWTEKTFEDLIALITRTVPEGRLREAALDRINARLNPAPGKAPVDEEAMMAHWNKPHTRPSRADHEAEIAKHWQAAGCSAWGAPHVVTDMARRLERSVSSFVYSFRGMESPFPINNSFATYSPFSGDSSEAAKLASAFLSDTCEGARGLSDAGKAILLKRRGPVVVAPPPPPAPSFSLWPW